MANKIQIRRDTTSNWGAVNPILSQGELGLDTTLNKIKIGNGTSHWSSLDFFIGDTDSRIANNSGMHAVSVSNTGVITMDTSRGSIEFGALPEVGGPNHFHIMKSATPAGNVDLYFGDDYNYMLQRNQSYGNLPAFGVEIGTNDNDGGDQNVWRFGTDGDLTLADNGGIVFDRNNTSIRVGMGFHIASGEGISLEAIDQTDPENLITKGWYFSPTGGINFPTLSVDIHNGGVQSAQVLKFDDTTQQVIITGPTPAAGSSAERIIIQGQRATGNGEGGDVYLWGGDSDYNGGDIKIYAGDADGELANASGGYINIDAGNGFTSGGNLSLSAGNANSSQVNSYGGNVNINAGYAYNGTPGSINLTTFSSAGAGHNWQFGTNGILTLPAGGDVVNSNGSSVLTDIYKFASGTIGTKANTDTVNGWGDYNMYLDPGGESRAFIFIPSNANQDGGASLQITNKGSATSIVQVIGWGGVQLVTNTGGSEKLFEFGDDGKLTLPAASLIVSETSSIMSVGAGLAELETTYTDLMLMLNDVFTAISSEPGYPWGVTLPVSVPLTYNQLIQLLPDTFTGQDNANVVAHNANMAYNVWRDAVAATNIRVNVSDKSWTFGNDGKFNFPNAASISESNNLEISNASAVYEQALNSWTVSQATWQLEAANASTTAAGWPFIEWDVHGDQVTTYQTLLANAWQVQNTPSSPPTALIFNPPISMSLYTQILNALSFVQNSYMYLNTLLKSIDITAGTEKLTLLANGKLVVPDIIQNTPEENLILRTRYAGASSPPNSTFYNNKDWTFGTNGTLTFPDTTIQTTAYVSNITNTTANGSAYLTPTSVMTRGTRLEVRAVYTDPNSLNMEFRYQGLGDQVAITANNGTNIFSGTSIGYGTTWTRFNPAVFVNPGEQAEVVICDQSYHKIYRVTAIMRDAPTGNDGSGSVYCTIEELK